VSLSAYPAGPHYLPVRPAWLARRQEDVLDPELPIIDAHHHLWDREGWRYLVEDLLQDVGAGHCIVATIFVQAQAMHGDHRRIHQKTRQVQRQNPDLGAQP
jgi:predicted TIM-barrel fold metal-dependent hydrolase